MIRKGKNMKYIMLFVTALLSYNACATDNTITLTNQHFRCESIKGKEYYSNANVFVNAYHSSKTNERSGVYLYSTKDHTFTMSIGDESEKGFFYGYMADPSTGGRFELKCTKL